MKNNKLSSIILWSVISAAFIGPGTITTAVSAGSRFHLDLVWAVGFATLACIIVQESAARITISSGLSLGQTFRLKFGDRWGRALQFSIGWIVIGGCAAFEAGNMVGAVNGLNMITNANSTYLVLLVSTVAALLLWLERPYWIPALMMTLVALMGAAFVVLAFRSHYPFSSILKAMVVPTVPNNSMLLILGLIGTTIVPYNIFLGSGISSQQSISLMRTGLIVSVLFGGIVTAFILVAGTLVSEFTSFSQLMTSFRDETGFAGVFALAAGLFGAGFSSAVTAPYAASIIASSVFGWEKWKGVLVWALVIITGAIFGISDFKPVRLIIIVQALNGIILPILIFLLILIVNDKKIIPEQNRPGVMYNIVLITAFVAVATLSGYHIYTKVF
ncbi:MAG TPA: divalent metal cation transporter [Cyclobacteriaceae bacterium]|nr:divalent metal cation transporter [Cyclobacteriaceae bacterium]